MNAPEGQLSGRLVSLDAYRGFIMLAMVSAGFGMQRLKDDPQWGRLAKQFEHVEWDGCTFWDLIQPSFMFMVGVAMPFAFAKRWERGETWSRQFLHVLKRAFLLVAIGIVMDSFKSNIPTVQFIRVLQQIAIGYVIAFFVLPLGPRGQAVAIVALLAGHTFAYVSYGDASAWAMTNQEVNFGRALDKKMRAPFESIKMYADIMPLSRFHYVTFNAISSAATILIGVMIGELLRSSWTPKRKALTLLISGAVLIGLGILAEKCGLPWVKKLWTASFALFAAGCTCWMMLVFYFLIDIVGVRGWAWPFVVVGVNSIFIYVSAQASEPSA